MKKIWILFFIPFLWAGDYVCHNNGTITAKYRSVDGSNLGDDCIRVPRETLNTLTKYKKVSGGNVVDMTQQEIDDLNAAEQAAADAAESSRVASFDDSVSASKASDAVLTKIDNSIDNITNLEDAKEWLKKLVRYLYSRY